MRINLLIALLALGFPVPQGQGPQGRSLLFLTQDSQTALGVIDQCRKDYFQGLEQIPVAYQVNSIDIDPLDSADIRKASLEYTTSVFGKTWAGSSYHPSTDFLRFLQPRKEKTDPPSSKKSSLICFKDKEGSIFVQWSNSIPESWEIWSTPVQGDIEYTKGPENDIRVRPWDPGNTPRPDPWATGGQEDLLSGLEFATWALKQKEGTSLEVCPGHLHLVWTVDRPILGKLPRNHGFHPGFYMIGGGIEVNIQETDSGWNFSEIQIDHMGNVLSRWSLQGIGAGVPFKKRLFLNFFPGTQVAMAKWDQEFSPMDVEEARKSWAFPDLKGRMVNDRRMASQNMERAYRFRGEIPSMEEFRKRFFPGLKNR